MREENDMETVLRLEGVTKHYPDFTLKDVSFKLERGFVMGLIGPNGAGKSTTIKLIMNLIRRDGGTIELFGMDNIKHELEIKERIGFVYDTIPYYGILTVNEMKSLIAPFYSHWDENLFQRYLREFDLNPNQQIDNLSRGTKTKFQLAVALSHNAELIIMDEPTSGLDPVFRSELLDILYDVIADEGKSVLFSTHITTDLEKIADHITFLNQGQVVFSLPKDELLDRYALVKGGLDILSHPEAKGRLLGVRKGQASFSALTTEGETLARRFGERVTLERASLDDIMVYSVRGERNV
jgi:ABC-2 type transport system ATP-binding protein